MTSVSVTDKNVMVLGDIQLLAKANVDSDLRPPADCTG